MAGMHDVERAVAHDHFFLTWPWTDGVPDFRGGFDFVGKKMLASWIHFCVPC